MKNPLTLPMTFDFYKPSSYESSRELIFQLSWALVLGSVLLITVAFAF